LTAIPVLSPSLVVEPKVIVASELIDFSDLWIELRAGSNPHDDHAEEDKPVMTFPTGTASLTA
jgi:hypothetical protein